MTRAQKILARSIALLGTLVVILAGFALRDVAWEQIFLYRLQSKDPDTRTWAAYHLGKLRSVRAIPLLLDEVESLPEPVRFADSQTPEEIVRSSAAIALVKVGADPETSRSLTPILASAARGGAFAKEAAEALQALPAAGAPAGR